MTTNPKTQNPEFQAKKEALMQLSKDARDLREKMIKEDPTNLMLLRSINWYIVNFFYRTETEHEFNTFKGWLEQGKVVKKGEKAKMIWAERIGATHKGETVNEETGEVKEFEKKYLFWPVAFIFSNEQVKDLD